MAADGVANSQIAATVGVTPVTVWAWRTRFAQEGLAKFSVVRGGRGRKPGITPEQIEEIFA
jgi:transposase